MYSQLVSSRWTQVDASVLLHVYIDLLVKRSRLHFLRGSKEEAARVAEEAKKPSLILRLVDALREMDSQPVIRAGNMDTTSNFEASGAAQDFTTM